MCNPVTTKFPEFLLAKGEHSGYEWEVTNNGIGYRCGYVRVPPGHPWHGKDYDDVPAEVHGGLTFAAPDEDCGKGGDDSAWWLGFDCAHCGDAPDASLPGRPGRVDALPNWTRDLMLMSTFPEATIKSTEYVAEQCRALAEQAAEAMLEDWIGAS